MNYVAFDFTNIHFIILLLLIIVISAYFYFEILKIKKIISIEYKPTHVDNTNINNTNINNVNKNEKHDEPIDISPPQTNEDKLPPLSSIVDIPDLTKGELTFENIENIMSSDSNTDSNSESDSISDSNSDRKSDRENTEKLGDKNINSLEEINFETGEIDPNFIYDDEKKIITTGINNKSVSELKEILSNMNLPLTGNKTKLIERINENK